MGKPKPFSRPSISISTGATGDKKEWRDVPPESVKPGDLLLGHGLVVGGTFTEVTLDDDPGTPVKVVVYEMKSGKQVRVQNQETVRAFVTVSGG